MLRKGPCMLTLVLCALAHSVKTWAGDSAALNEPSPAEKAAGPGVPAATIAFAANPFALNAAVDSRVLSTSLADPIANDFSTTEFRPRQRNRTATTPDYGSGDPLFRTTTVWQRLNEFRAQDRVRVLTLWEMGSSNVSLQAGKKGDPSLQWSSSWTNQSKTSRGLLDRVLAATLSGMVNRGNAAHYSQASSAPPKPLITTAVPAAK
jgi:hypothetical protein